MLCLLSIDGYSHTHTWNALDSTRCGLDVWRGRWVANYDVPGRPILPQHSSTLMLTVALFEAVVDLMQATFCMLLISYGTLHHDV